MTSGPPHLADLLLAYRQAKRSLATERGAVGVLDLARYELKLDANLRELQGKLAGDSWFDHLQVGRLVVLPKSTSPESAEGNDDIVRVGVSRDRRVTMTVRLQLEASIEFAVAEILYLREFGPALEALLGDECVGYRLKRVAREGAMDRFDRDLYEHWPTAFARYRDDPIKVARSALEGGKRVIVTSTDVVSFFDAIDPSFLLSTEHVARLLSAATAKRRDLDVARYVRATSSLLTKFGEFRRLRREVAAGPIDEQVGVPIGAATSRVFANVALAGFDAHVSARPGVALYRRYVDDIVVVSVIDGEAPVPASRAAVLGALLPGFSRGAHVDRFLVPDTGAAFELKEEKTRIHELSGAAGLDFLSAVQQSFSLVSSERRAFLGDIEKLENDLESIDLFGGDAGSDRVPRLRDADRFTLRRFMATAFVRGLERCALLLDRSAASRIMEERTRRMLSILDESIQLEDFDLALALLRVSLTAGSTLVTQRLRNWLKARSSRRVQRHVQEVVWRGQTLDRGKAWKKVADYLGRRLFEGEASAAPLATPTKRVSMRRAAWLLRRADLRHLDREDDQLLGQHLPELPRAARQDHKDLAAAVRNDSEVAARLTRVAAFITRSLSLQEDVWRGATPIGLFVSVRPPRFSDVARRFLARMERMEVAEDLGRDLDLCVDALRGTRYGRRPAPVVSAANMANGNAVLTVDGKSASAVRLVLSNLPVEVAAFVGAATGTPMLTLQRLRQLDEALRTVGRAAGPPGRRQRPVLLVLPELAVPAQWARALVEHAVREEWALVAGLEYAHVPAGLVNQAIGVFPAGRRSAAVVRWTKHHAARGEAAALQKLTPPRSLAPTRRSMRRLIVESEHGRLGVLICSEILEADALAALRGSIELLVVPAWNDDTPSFDHMVNAAASLLVHGFIGVANNAAGSDTRIVAPVKEPRHEREWARLIHRQENQVIWGDLPLDELRCVHDGHRPPTLIGPACSVCERRAVLGREYRPLPPGWGR